jgi:TetR/AcrR family transcriptional regulator, fatty acid biosynthesis regulator
MNLNSAEQQEGSGLPAGKQKLIDAALRLSARDGTTLSSLGLRELAREAGLNHNTFYRHFRRADELGQAAAEEVAAQLMSGIKEIRRRAARRADATLGVVEYFIDFVLGSPDVFIVGARELHSIASPMRAVLLRVLEDIARESVDQISAQDLAPLLPRELLFYVSLDITNYLFDHSLDVIDRPQNRKQLTAQFVAHIRRQFFGAMPIQQTRDRKPRS